MNRVDFMKRLEELLSEIAPAEKEEAIQYYHNYFDDAGEENESSVIEELGSPEKVAETIKADLYGKAQDDWEFTEAGCTNTGGRKKAPVVTMNSNTEGQQSRYGTPYQNQYQSNPNGYGTSEKPKTDTGKIILVILILLVTSPLWLSVAGVVLSVVFAVLATLFALFVAFIAVTVAFLIAGVALFGFSFAKMMISPLLGFMTMGIGLLMLGIGLLFLLLSIWICGKVIPALCRGIVRLCRMPFQRRGGQPA